jgi:CRP/FNR family transcriptional regulator, cyclic AMP receptor protein
MMAQDVAGLAPLDRFGWLAGQPEDFRNWVAQNGRWREFAPGQELYEAGDDANGLFGLAEGGLELSLPLTDDEPVTFYRAEVGFWIGDSALLSGKPRLISISAAVRSRVFFVPRSLVLARLERNPGDWQAFYALSHVNMARLLDALGEALALSPRARVARLLLRLSAGSSRVETSQEELARLIGVRRATLQRALHEMIEQGWITSGYRQWEIRNREALERISQEV